jgi:hypothetical protein
MYRYRDSKTHPYLNDWWIAGFSVTCSGIGGCCQRPRLPRPWFWREWPPSWWRRREWPKLPQPAGVSTEFVYGLCMDYVWTMYRLYIGCDYAIETMYGICLKQLCNCLWMLFVKSVLLVKFVYVIVYMCILLWIKRCRKICLGGGIKHFCRPIRRPTKIHAGRQLFLWATGADENKAPIFVGHRGRRKYSAYFRRPWGSRRKRSFLSVPTEIVAYFRWTYFRRLFRRFTHPRKFRCFL